MSLVTLEIEQVAEVVDEAVTRHDSIIHRKIKRVCDDIEEIRTDLIRVGNDKTLISSTIESLNTLKNFVESCKGELEEIRTLQNSTNSRVNYIVDTQEGIIQNSVKNQIEKIEVSKPQDGLPGKDADPVDMDALHRYLDGVVDEKISNIPIPKDGDPGLPGEPGKSVDLDELRQIIRSTSEEIISELSKPKDGEPGKSVDFDELERFIVDTATKIINNIPKPKEVDINQLYEHVDKHIQDRVALIPAPKDGTPGEPGTSIDVDEIKKYLQELVNEIPTPKDGEPGKSVDIDKLYESIDNKIEEKVSSIAIPAPPEIDLESFRKFVEECAYTCIKNTPIEFIPFDDKTIDDKLDRRLEVIIDSVKSIRVLSQEDVENIVSKLVGMEKDYILERISNIDNAPSSIDNVKEIEYAPDEVAEKVAKAIAIVAESPMISVLQPPMIINVTQPIPSSASSSSPLRPTGNKRIVTHRDKDGNIVAEVSSVDEIISVRKE